MAKGKIEVGRSGLWRPSVYPYLEQLASQLDVKSEISVSVDIDGVRLLVTPLEQELVLSLREEEEAPFERKHILVRDGLGLRIKLLTELNSLAQQSSRKRGDTLDAIKEDIGLGCQLMHEITLEMRSISGADQINEAREFSQYRQQLSRVIAEAERRIANRSGVSEDTNVWNNGYAPKVKTDAKNTKSAQAHTERETSPIVWLVLIATVVGAGAAVAWYLLQMS